MSLPNAAVRRGWLVVALAAMRLLAFTCTALAEVDRDNPILPIDEPIPPGDPLGTITVTAPPPVDPPVDDGPTEGGPPGYGGIGVRGAPFEHNRGETALVHDASVGDPDP